MTGITVQIEHVAIHAAACFSSTIVQENVGRKRPI